MCQSCSTPAVAPAGGSYPAGKAHTAINPYVPNASIIRFPNGIFELHLHLPGVVSQVELVPFDNYVLVRGTLVPRARKDVEGRISTLVWTDQACGEFARDVPICLSPGTEFVVLERRHECDDYIVRYTVRNSVARGHCSNNLGSNCGTAPVANANTTCGTGNGYGYGYGNGHGYGHGHGHGHGVAHGSCLVHGPYTNPINTPRGAYCTCAGVAQF